MEYETIEMYEAAMLKHARKESDAENSVKKAQTLLDEIRDKREKSWSELAESKRPTIKQVTAFILVREEEQEQKEKLLRAEKRLEELKRLRPIFARDRGRWSECLDPGEVHTLILTLGFLVVLGLSAAVLAVVIQTT
jgi:hypothetical protein